VVVFVGRCIHAVNNNNNNINHHPPTHPLPPALRPPPSFLPAVPAVAVRGCSHGAGGDATGPCQGST
jgi:hypothetical protein